MGCPLSPNRFLFFPVLYLCFAVLSLAWDVATQEARVLAPHKPIAPKVTQPSSTGPGSGVNGRRTLDDRWGFQIVNLLKK